LEGRLFLLYEQVSGFSLSLSLSRSPKPEGVNLTVSLNLTSTRKNLFFEKNYYGNTRKVQE
jgi:hypothetical protein